MSVRVQSEPFDQGVELVNFAKSMSDVGAVVTFTGLVRDIPGELKYMDIEHYPAMTQSAIEGIEATACSRWSLTGCLIIHRYGRLNVGDTIMMVATASLHRAAAFKSAEFLMDYLKSRAPFWKKEVSEKGEEWIAAKDDDEDALKRW